MTEATNTYQFDFLKEAQDLRETLGEKGKDTLFVEVALRAGENPESPEILMRTPADSAEAIGKCGPFIQSLYSENPGYGSKGFILREGGGEGPVIGRAVALKEEGRFNASFGAENTDLMRLWELYHETGHILIEHDAGKDNPYPFWEAASDAYAALRLFQRFGNEAKELTSMISWLRTINAISGDVDHLSSPVLDKIIADSGKEDFSKLDAEETARRAEAYAKEWTPAAATLENAALIFRQGEDIDLALINATCLGAPDNFAFYIGAKFFQPFLQPEGIVLNGAPYTVAEDKRERYAERIARRSPEDMRLRETFATANDDTEESPSLAEALKVSLRRGQKQFVVNT